jgi:hypothetical protein
MPTVSDLGRRIKRKYPGAYDDLSDEEVGRRIKAKYPGDYGDFVDDDIEMVRYEPKTPTRTEHHIEELKEYYRPSRGRFTSWVQRGKSEGRNKLLEVLNQEQALVIQQGAMLESAIREGRKSEADFQVYIAQHAATLFNLKANEQLIENALSRGRTLEIDQHLILESGLSEIRLSEEQRRVQIKVDEHKQLSEIDVEKDYAIRMNQLRGILAVKLFTHTKLKELRGMVKDLLLERHEVEVSDLPDSVKDNYKALLDGTIETYKRAYDVGQARLLEGADGEDVGGVDEDNHV